MSDPAQKPHRQYARTSLYIRSPKAMTKRDKRTERLIKRMFDVLPHLQMADRPTAKAWAQLEILADCCFTELREHGVFNSEMESRRLLHDFRQLRTAQLPFANALGLTPLSRFQIKADSDRAAFDIAQAASERIDRLAPQKPSRADAETAIPALETEKPDCGASDNE